MTFADKIQVVRSTFEAYSTAKAGTLKLDMSVQDVYQDDVLTGVRLVIPVEPTIQAVFCPTEEHPDLVGVFVFPGDDAATSGQHVLEIANAIRSTGLNLNPVVVGVIAPNYSQEGVSFTVALDEVYSIYENFIRRRAQWLDERDANAPQTVDVKVNVTETGITPE
jgi:hypothetical protein